MKLIKGTYVVKPMFIEKSRLIQMCKKKPTGKCIQVGIPQEQEIKKFS